MTLNRAKDWADFVLKVTSIIALVVGAAWAYWTFGLTRTDIPNVKVAISTETIPYQNNFRLLIVHINIKNIGKVLFSPGSKGFHLFVKKLPKDLQYGQLLEPTTGKLFKEIDILRNDEEGYELEPGVDYDEVETLVVSKGDNFSLEAELWWPNNDDLVNNKKIVRVD